MALERCLTWGEKLRVGMRWSPKSFSGSVGLKIVKEETSGSVRHNEESWETNLRVASGDAGLPRECSAPVNLHFGGSIGSR